MTTKETSCSGGRQDGLPEPGPDQETVTAMANDNSKTGDAGSHVVPQRRSDGTTGPSREVSQEDPESESDGQENAELEWGRRNIPEDPVSNLVERKTEIIGCGIRMKKRSRVFTTEMLMQKHVLPILERMQGELLRQIDYQAHRIGKLEKEVESLKEWRRS